MYKISVSIRVLGSVLSVKYIGEENGPGLMDPSAEAERRGAGLPQEVEWPGCGDAASVKASAVTLG